MPRNVPDWKAIREQYESTSIGPRHLARAWGFKSHNSIARKIKNENWTKDIAAIAANIVTQDITGAPFDRQLEEEPKTPEITQNQESDQNRDHVVTSPPPVTEPRSQRSHNLISDEKLDAHEARAQVAIAKAEGIATMQSNAIRRQIEVSDALHRTGSIIAERLQTVMLSEDPEERRAAQRALLSINPDRETLSSLAKAAELLLRTSIAMRRQAVGLDKQTMQTADTSGAPQPVRAVLARLDTDALMKLRQVSLDISRLPPVPQGGLLEGEVAE